MAKKRKDVKRGMFIEKIFHQRKQARLEAGLDAFLTLLALELEIKTPWEKALWNAGMHSPSPLKEEMKELVERSTKKGMRLEESLVLFSQKWNSPLVARTVTLLMHISVQGANENAIRGLKQAANDSRIFQQTLLRIFAQKLGVLSLVFIGVSALVPSLFLGFVTIGSQFLELSLTPFDLGFVLLVIFPLVDAGILFLVWASTPAFLFPGKEKNLFQGTKKINVKMFQLFFKKIITFFSAEKEKELLRSSVIEGACLFLIAWSWYLHAQPSPFWLAGVLSVSFFPLASRMVWKEIEKEQRIQKMEKQVPDSLVMLASFPSTLSFEKQVSELSRISVPPLKTEWEKVVSRIEKGSSVPHALKELGKNDSPVLKKLQHLLTRAYRSGASFQSAALGLADEVLSSHALHDERRATLLIQKYTILGAGGILIPLLLGIMVGVVQSLSFEGTTGQSLFSASVWGIRLYLGEYALLAGLFLGLQENKMGHGIGYMLVLIPASQIIHTIGLAFFSA